MPLHGDQRAVRQHEVGPLAEFLDEAENVIPAAAVQAGRVLAQFVENFVHFERGENGLDQHGGADRAARNAQLVLREAEHIVPQARFEMAFHLRQIEVRAGASIEQLFGVVKEEQAEIEQRAGDRLAVDQEVLLVQMPAARTHHQRGQFRIQARSACLPG